WKDGVACARRVARRRPRYRALVFRVSPVSGKPKIKVLATDHVQSGGGAVLFCCWRSHTEVCGETSSTRRANWCDGTVALRLECAGAHESSTARTDSLENRLLRRGRGSR